MQLEQKINSNRLQEIKNCICSRHTALWCVLGVYQLHEAEQTCLRHCSFSFHLHSASLFSESTGTLRGCQCGDKRCSSAVNTEGWGGKRDNGVD